MFDAANPNPELINQISKRLRKHLKIGEPKVRLSKWAPITASVSAALHDQAHQYANRLTDQPDQSVCAMIQSAVVKFITARHPYQCPVKFTPTTKFAQRNNELGSRLPIGTHEELRAYAKKHGLTVAAVVRRAVYEYTKPETPDPVAAIDAWADRAKLVRGLEV